MKSSISAPLPWIHEPLMFCGERGCRVDEYRTACRRLTSVATPQRRYRTTVSTSDRRRWAGVGIQCRDARQRPDQANDGGEWPPFLEVSNSYVLSSQWILPSGVPAATVLSGSCV